MDTGRLEAFSDGVIAIAITLLVLDLRVPVQDHHQLAHALAHEWPAYVGYAVSFVTIGIVWINHHAMFQRVQSVDHTLLFANLFLLAGIGLVPFTTSLAARWLRESPDNRVALLIYCLNFLVISASFTGLWRHLTRRPQLLAAADRDVAAAALRRSVVGPIAYATASAIAPIFPIVGFAICGIAALYFARQPRPSSSSCAASRSPRSVRGSGRDTHGSGGKSKS